MSPRSAEQFQEIRNEKIELIMNSALALFAEKGYENTSISAIAKQAKISKGLLYNYFKSKEDLLIAILDHGIEQMHSLFDQNKDGVLESHELRFFIEEMFAMLKAHRPHWKLFFQMSFQSSVFGYMNSRLEKVIKSIHELTIDYFRRVGFENPEGEALIFGAALDGAAFDYVLKPDLFPIDVLKDTLIKKYCDNQNIKN